ncbi:DinB family protein [Planomicrobium sp. CPCC 101079]|uniref:DinB family protein n=1 Tax=Planomicrobium sp. CPCC 101079 TaxID=2599618 RepID=UPI0011B53904|nr:DinB family protein [Planomicrobium sp. CPCC 101079]TWT13240.1 DinB family protein [Planomicrobium sp. CPCC 101079]
MIDYQVSSLEGYTDKIGELCFLLEHARAVTLSEIEDLSQAELDYLVYADDNSIGALLLHIASIEKVHQVITFEKRDFTALEYAEWRTAVDLQDGARRKIRGKGLDFYLHQLSAVREQTLKQLRLFGDDWLYEQSHWPNGTPINNYYLWFHVLEDEISHRGQIRLIKRRLLTSRK